MHQAWDHSRTDQCLPDLTLGLGAGCSAEALSGRPGFWLASTPTEGSFCGEARAICSAVPAVCGALDSCAGVAVPALVTGGAEAAGCRSASSESGLIAAGDITKSCSAASVLVPAGGATGLGLFTWCCSRLTPWDNSEAADLTRISVGCGSAASPSSSCTGSILFRPTAVTHTIDVEIARTAS